MDRYDLQTTYCKRFRAIFVWPWNENARTKQKQQTNGNRAIWLVYRTDTNACGFWLVKRTHGWKNFMPENFLEIKRCFVLTSYCNTIGQSNNALSILGFSLAENEESTFWSFHPLAGNTNNEHLPKPLDNTHTIKQTRTNNSFRNTKKHRPIVLSLFPHF